MTYVNQANHLRFNLESFKRRMIGLIDMKEESGPKSRYSYTPTFCPVVLYLWPKLHRCDKCKKCHKLYRRLYFLVKLNSSPCWIEAALPFEGFMFFVFDILWSVTNTKYFYFWPCLRFSLLCCWVGVMVMASLLFLSFILVLCSCLLFLSSVFCFVLSCLDLLGLGCSGDGLG